MLKNTVKRVTLGVKLLWGISKFVRSKYFRVKDNWGIRGKKIIISSQIIEQYSLIFIYLSRNFLIFKTTQEIMSKVNFRLHQIISFANNLQFIIKC